MQKKTQTGEITTFLTLFTLGVMLLGVIAGSRLTVNTVKTTPQAREIPNECGVSCVNVGRPDSSCIKRTSCQSINGRRICWDDHCNTAATNTCNQACQNNLDCGGLLSCVRGQCRNQLCRESTSCSCESPTPSPSPSPTPATGSGAGSRTIPPQSSCNNPCNPETEGEISSCGSLSCLPSCTLDSKTQCTLSQRSVTVCRNSLCPNDNDCNCGLVASPTPATRVDIIPIPTSTPIVLVTLPPDQRGGASQLFGTPTPIRTPQQACQAGGGVWNDEFPNGCADTCGPTSRQCTQQITAGCNCVSGCWDGARCVAAANPTPTPIKATLQGKLIFKNRSFSNNEHVEVDLRENNAQGRIVESIQATAPSFSYEFKKLATGRHYLVVLPGLFNQNGLVADLRNSTWDAPNCPSKGNNHDCLLTLNSGENRTQNFEFTLPLTTTVTPSPTPNPGSVGGTISVRKAYVDTSGNKQFIRVEICDVGPDNSAKCEPYPQSFHGSNHFILNDGQSQQFNIALIPSSPPGPKALVVQESINHPLTTNYPVTIDGCPQHGNDSSVCILNSLPVNNLNIRVSYTPLTPTQAPKNTDSPARLPVEPTTGQSLTDRSQIAASFTIVNNGNSAITTIKVKTCNQSGSCTTTTKPVSIQPGAQQSVRESIPAAAADGRYTISCSFVDASGKETACPNNKTTSSGDGVKFNLAVSAAGTVTGTTKTTLEFVDRNGDGVINALDYAAFSLSTDYNALDMSTLIDALGRKVNTQ